MTPVASFRTRYRAGSADEPGGYLIFECHGFRDDSIADRMHLKISKADSPRPA